MSLTTRKQKIGTISKAKKGAEEGRQYEEILLVTLATRAYELSKQENPKFREFDICREIKIGKYRKFDDIVFSYVDQDNEKKLIFVQLKHKQDYKLIDSRILSTEEARTKDIKGPYGYLCEAFNLQKYFISYLSVKEELEHTNTKELKDGIMKYVILSTNVGLNCKELEEKGFVLKKAPDDIVNLFTLNKQTLETQHSVNFYQLKDVSEDLLKVLKKSSDLDRIARELAQCVVCKNHRKNEIMGKAGTPVEHYQSWLGNYVIKTSDKVHTIKITEKRKKNKQKFREAQFTDEFLKSAAHNLQPLRNALFKAIREIDKSKKGVNDDDLKKDLKAAKWKIVPNFDQSKQNIKTDFQCKRMSVEDGDIKDFLQCFVFIVNQPGVAALDLLYKQYVQGVVAENTSLKQVQDQTYAAGEELKKLVKKDAIIKQHNDEKWISCNPIEHFFQEKSQRVDITFDVSAMTRMYKKEVMQYGKFNDVGKKLENIDSFLKSNCKILCLNTPVTLLSSIKLLQHLDAENDLISVNLNILNYTENRDYVLQAFKLENISLLTMECRHVFKEHDINFLYELVNIATKNSNKKIILIMQLENSEICTKRFETDFQDEEIFVIENDSIDLKVFEAKEDPLAKKVLAFQGQKEKVSVSDITGIKSWNSYVDNLSEGNSGQGLIDGMTLVDILSNDEIEVGSKPAGTSSLEGAYAQMYEEINMDTLVNKLMSQEHDNDTNDMYIISGIPGFSKRDKTDKLIQYFGENNENEEFKNRLEEFKNRLKIVSVHILEVVDDPFKVKDFHRYCHNYPEKRIFWICLEWEKNATKFMLQEIYNPKFYLKRKFKEYIDDEQGAPQGFDHKCSEISLIDEDKLIGKIKDRKVVIFADEPGMGKTTTLIKLYETQIIIKSFSIIKSHWVIGIKLRDHLEAVRDLELKNDGISIVNVAEFLSKVDLKLNNNLAKNLLKIVLDKSKSFQAKPLLLIFDGFDEVLDAGDRKRILLLLQFIKDKTAAKMWITTRCHFKNLLEETLSTIAIQFSPMDDAEHSQYITTYLQHRLYLTLNKDKYTDLFDTEDEKQNNVKIHMYTAAFINKMKSIFRGDISTFIGTPLQLYLMLEDTVRDFKNWIEGGGVQMSVFKYVRNDVWGVYEYFINKKYDVYFQKVGIRERERQGFEKCNIDRYHKGFAVSKIPEVNRNDEFEKFKDVFLLVGVIKSQGRELEFIHKTFEEFFASKVFFDWIKKVPEKQQQEYLLKGVFMKPYYRLVRTFINLQLQKMTEQAVEVERLKDLDTNLKLYGDVAAELLNNKRSPLINEDEETPLHIAVQEGNKDIACFLLNILKGQPDVLKKFLFIPKSNSKTALHLACTREDVEIVRALLDAAAGIPDDTLQESIVYTFATAQMSNKNVEICKELLDKADSKLYLIFSCSNPYYRSALCTACFHGRENFVELYLQEFENDKPSLKSLLLCNDMIMGNALGCVRSTTTVEKLISAAKSMKDNNETLKKLLLPNKGKLPFEVIVMEAELDVVEKVLDVAKEIDEDTLKKLLLNDRYEPGKSVLHVAEQSGRVDIMKLLLEKAFTLGIVMLEKLITAVNEQGKSAIQLIFEHGHEAVFEDFLKIFEEDKYKKNRKQVIEMFDNILLESRLYWYKKNLFKAIELNHIKDVKDILRKVKNFRNRSRRILLLSDKYFERNTLHIACELGNDEIIKELISYAKETDDDNNTLQQLLLSKSSGESALHVGAKRGHANIIKKLLEAASDLGIELLEKLIFARNQRGENAIQLMAEHGHETVFADSFKMLSDEYPIIWKKVMEMYDNILLEKRLYWDKEKLIMAIESGDIQKVKDILSNAKISSINSNERLSILLLSKTKCGISTLHSACKEGNIEIMKELLFYAKDINDDNFTLKQLLLIKRNEKSALHVAAEKGHIDITKLLLDTASAINIDDDNYTLKQLLSNEGYGESALHVAAREGHFDVTKLLLETASALDIDNDIHTLKQLLFSNEGYGGSALHVAARGGHFDITKLLLETASALDIDDDNHTLKQLLFSNERYGGSALHVAAREGHLDVTKLLLETASALDIDDDNHTLKEILFSNEGYRGSALHVAASRGHFDITKLLLETASALDIDDDNYTLKQLLSNQRYGESALHVAARWGHFHITELLLETASSLGTEILEELIFAVNKRGENAIQLMAEHGHKTTFADSFKMLKDDYLIIWKKVMETYDNILLERRLYRNKEKLFRAIESGDIQKVKDILSNAKNSNINSNERLSILLLSKTECGISTLHSACKEGNIKIMKELLCYAKEIDDDNYTLKQLLTLKKNGKPALHVAAKKGHINITKLLLDTAPALDIDDDNYTLKRLLSNEGYGESALHIASRGGHFDISKLLLETASALDIDDDNHTLKQLLFSNEEYGGSALHVAARGGHFDITKLLLETASASDINDDNHILKQLLFLNEGYEGSALHVAAGEGHFDVTKLLLETASALDIDDDNHTLKQLLFSNEGYGGSAVHVAARWGHFSITKLLLETASALDIDDNNNTLKQLLSNERYGESALHVAARWGHFHITKLLLETASSLGSEILEELIFAGNKRGENAIHLMAEHGHETTFSVSFKMLKDEYPIIWKKVMEIYDNIPLERRLYWDKRKLIRAIESGDIQKVKDILSGVENSSFNPNESLKILLLSKKQWRNSTLYTAWKERNTEIMKELLSYAMNMDDGGETLKELLTKPTSMSPLTPLKALKHEIEQIVDILIIEARNNSRDHAVDILEQIKNLYSDELDVISKETIFMERLILSYFDSSSS